MPRVAGRGERKLSDAGRVYETIVFLRIYVHSRAKGEDYFCFVETLAMINIVVNGTEIT